MICSHRRIFSLSSIALFATLAFAAAFIRTLITSSKEHARNNPSPASAAVAAGALVYSTTAPSATKPMPSDGHKRPLAQRKCPHATDGDLEWFCSGDLAHGMPSGPAPHRAALATCRLPEVDSVKNQPQPINSLCSIRRAFW